MAPSRWFASRAFLWASSSSWSTMLSSEEDSLCGSRDLSQRDHKYYKGSCQLFGELLIKKEQILLVISAITGTF